MTHYHEYLEWGIVYMTFLWDYNVDFKNESIETIELWHKREIWLQALKKMVSGDTS